MLRDQSDGNDSQGATESDNDEELYQRLFKKIARDFVSKDDLENLIGGLLEEIVRSQNAKQKLDSTKIGTSDMGAAMKAIEYKENLALPKHKRRKYKDVIEDDK